MTCIDLTMDIFAVKLNWALIEFTFNQNKQQNNMEVFTIDVEAVICVSANILFLRGVGMGLWT